MDQEMQSKSEAISNLLKSISILVRGNVEGISISGESIQVRLLLPSLDSREHPNLSKSSLELVVDPNDFRDVPFTSLRDGSYESLITRLLLAFGASSTVFLDVGSNVGFYCVALAKAFPELTVHAIEPNPSVWVRWENHQVINNLEGRCVLHRAGLSQNDEETVFYVPTVTGSGGGSSKVLHPDEPQTEISVSLRTPDSLELPDELSLVKIDVEGAELDVVRALESRFLNYKPTIVIELLRKWMAPFDSQPQDVVEILRDIGYQSFAIGADSIIPMTQIDGNTLETNFVFIHEENMIHLARSKEFHNDQISSPA